MDNVLIKIQPEHDFSRVEMYFSLDSNFNLIEEVPASHIMNDGTALRFNSKDETWCFKCYVYVIINVFREQRYYMVTKSSKGNRELSGQASSEIIVNAF